MPPAKKPELKPGDSVESRAAFAENRGRPVRDAHGREWWLHAATVHKIS